jgi:hypothetical protein
MKQRITALALSLALASAAFAGQQQSSPEPVERATRSPFVLHDGTPVRLRLGRNLSSHDAQTGETVDFEVLDDVLSTTP